VRTYHTLDADIVPVYSAVGRQGCLLSGAVSGVYPLRWRLFREAGRLPRVTVLGHPGYHRRGCATPDFLRQLSRHKVAVCTASIYGYALRKIAEATACGCVVITDLPTDEVMPQIDGNLVRVHPETTTAEIAALLDYHYAHYTPERQQHYARLAMDYYDYRVEGKRLAAAIEEMRRAYPVS
jgi:hypothetical protein